MISGRFVSYKLLYVLGAAIFVFLVDYVTKQRPTTTSNAQSASDPGEFFYLDTLSKRSFESRAQLIGETCEDIWKNWVKTGETPLEKRSPSRIPDDLYDKYTIFGKIPVKRLYFNQMAKAGSRLWNNIDKQVNQDREKVIEQSTYRKNTDVLYDAMTKFKEFVSGKEGAVVGSQLPWSEVYALKHGAKSVLTIEYQKLNIRTKQPVSYIHPFTLAANWTNFAEKLDFVVSFSSIEHSGLGRYGDPLDPFGDLREMGKMRCLLKDGGLMFIGFPVGKDALAWNAHRVYGPFRLEWMFLGFRVLGVFWHHDNGVEFTEGFPVRKINDMGLFKHTQPAIVLQKVLFDHEATKSAENEA